MFRYFKINEQGMKEIQEKIGNCLVIQDSTEKEREEIVQRYQLPNDIFLESKTPEDVSRLEKLQKTRLKDPLLLTLIDLSFDVEPIEASLHPVTFIYAQGLLIIHLSKKTSLLDVLLKEKNKKLFTAEEVIFQCILLIYDHYIKKLRQEKEKIDRLDQAAHSTTENKELFELANVKRTMVYLDHSLRDQQETLDRLIENKPMMERLDNESLLYDVKLRQRFTNKMVSIYRDLLESIGELFSDMIDNNLNHILKYLDSAALVISIPTLLFGLWGMNTGGLPGEKWSLGTLVIVLLALVSTVLASVHLFRKDYSK